MDLVTLYHQANDAWNRHDRGAYVALYADDCEIVAPGGSTRKGHQGVLDFWAESAGPFPDNRATPRTVVADGTTVVEESVWEGTNTGPLTMPDGSELPPTGAVVSVPYVGVHTVRAGGSSAATTTGTTWRSWSRSGSCPADGASTRRPAGPSNEQPRSDARTQRTGRSFERWGGRRSPPRLPSST